jgi:hypothetical protein
LLAGHFMDGDRIIATLGNKGQLEFKKDQIKV